MRRAIVVFAAVLSVTAGSLQASRNEPASILETDQEFDDGSGIRLAELSESQIGNLVILGKVWGFLKYHHPRVASGDDVPSWGRRVAFRRYEKLRDQMTRRQPAA